MPSSLHVEGRVDDGDEGDWYRLEPLPGPGELTFSHDWDDPLPGHRRRAGADPLTATTEEGVYRSPPLPAGASVAVGVSAVGAYGLDVDPGATGLVAAPLDSSAGSPLSVSMRVAHPDVAAFVDVGQRVEASISLANPGDMAVDVRLDAATTHPDWRLELESDSVSVGPGAVVDVPAAVLVPAQAWVDTPVRLTVRARDGAGQVTAYVEVTPRGDAAPVEPFAGGGLPPELLGGLDVAAAGLGATPLVSVDPAGEAALHDGVAPLGSGLDVLAAAPLTLTVDLAGDVPVPVVGTILDPLAGSGVVAGTVRGFELLLSEDGASYESVYEGEFSGALNEQAFVLAQPVPARFAQLRITSGFPGADRLRLGEWKVVAAPDWRPTRSRSTSWTRRSVGTSSGSTRNRAVSPC